VDTDKRTVLAIDDAGRQAFGPDDRVSHRSLPGLRFPAITLFQSP